MNTMLLNIIKSLFFKDVIGAWKEDKDKPIYLKKRFLGVAGVMAGGLVGSMGYQFDPQAIVKLAENINLMVIAGDQIIVICKQSWPVLLTVYSILLGIVGVFDKNSRDKIAKVLGEPKPVEAPKVEG